MRFALYIIALISFISCKKSTCKENIICANGYVLYRGDPAADGLGWGIIFENGKVEKPSNFPGNFKTDSLAVSVCYEETTEKFACECINGGFNMIRIVSITKR